MMYRCFLNACLLIGLCVYSQVAIALDDASQQPNIVVMLADDMGFGELQCLNPDHGKIATPNLDALSKAGMVFTDAHSGSSVCTPTRYGLLTGRYAWRTRLQRGVLQGGKSLIAQETLTIAEMLKTRGYHTAIVGKWHLGMLFDGVENFKKGAVKPGAKVTHGPIDFGGFDEFHGFHHARQMDLWIDNDVVTKKIEAIDMLPSLTASAVSYIKQRKNSKQPFFLYVPWNSPHSPVVPSKPWQGKSGINAHADFVMQTDNSFGQVIAALKSSGKLENTLIICSSDNGTSPSTSGLKALTKAGHRPSGELRGMKSDIWDGGHRVPFIASWPSKVKGGSSCDDLVCLTDIMATVAEIVDYPLADRDAVDSFSFLKPLLNQGPAIRDSVVHHSMSGEFAIRKGNWKWIACPGSGGWGKPKTPAAAKAAQQTGLPVEQLYNMSRDLSESENLAADKVMIAADMRKTLLQLISDGRSTAGPKLDNDVKVKLEKWKDK